MGKSRRGSKEITREQKLIKENRQLKRELAHLRKQIARVDLDRFETLRQMVTDQEEAQRLQDSVPISNTEALKKEWACKECTGGVLEIVLYPKLGQTFYYRACSNCDNRTQGQRYGETVRGIIKK